MVVRYKHWKPTEEDIKNVESLAARGMDEQDIALCLDLYPTTLTRKKAEFKQLEQAIKRGKAKGLANVTAALLKNVKNGNVTAQIFYLKCKGKWKDVHQENTMPKDEALKENENIRNNLKDY